MRHRFKKARKINTGAQKSSLVVRNLLTSLVEHGQITTTVSKARVLKVEADKLVAKLVSLFDKYEEKKDVKREAIRIVKSIIMTEDAGKKLVNDLLPKYQEEGRKSGFVSDYKLGMRDGDSAEKILVKLV